MSVALMVLLSVLVLAVVQAAIWTPLLRSWRRQSNRFASDFAVQADMTGERIVKGPEPAVYRGGTGPYSKVKGNGTMILTDRRIVFRKLTGGLVEVPRSKVIGIRQTKGFNGSRVGGTTHLVVATSDPAEVGFFVEDMAPWERALAG